MVQFYNANRGKSPPVRDYAHFDPYREVKKQGMDWDMLLSWAAKD